MITRFPESKFNASASYIIIDFVCAGTNTVDNCDYHHFVLRAPTSSLLEMLFRDTSYLLLRIRTAYVYHVHQVVIETSRFIASVPLPVGAELLTSTLFETGQERKLTSICSLIFLASLYMRFEVAHIDSSLSR